MATNLPGGNGAPDRSRGDLCPGVLTPFSAADGAIIRLRAPGGLVAVATLRRLVELAETHGAPFLQLTSRGNLQLRGLPDPLGPDLVAAVDRTGLVPSASHERMRNLLCSPLTGIEPRNTPTGPAARTPDVRRLVIETDRLLRADPDLARLPGRFLFAFDDGRGDVLAEHWDLAWEATDAETGTLRVGPRHGVPGLPVGAAASTLLELARAFQRVRTTLSPTPWHVRELPDPTVLGEAVVAVPAPVCGPQPADGPIGSAMVLGVPLGRLTGPQIDLLAEFGEQVVLTPWKNLVVPRVAASRLGVLRRAGFITAPQDTWAQVTACTGLPGCRKSSIDTLRLAQQLVDALPVPPRLSVHLVGCERACGTPSREHVTLVAPAGVDEALRAL
ncbi:hypothetical protein [Granulicoccus phenolivorans]|uniref:hypothetical protein n=1 Tax=Granulicoccus phenolivorans TaxID=266854 RepID=UPI00047EC399|nr:hypothetical protein [Granulicoccus phenolivorans]